MKKEYFPFICAAFMGFLIYALFAFCYGAIPYYWEGSVKGFFIAIELFIVGFVFLIATIETTNK